MKLLSLLESDASNKISDAPSQVIKMWTDRNYVDVYIYYLFFFPTHEHGHGQGHQKGT